MSSLWLGSGVLSEVDVDLELYALYADTMWMGAASCGLGFGEPRDVAFTGVMRGGWVLECRTGMFKNSSGCCGICCRVEGVRCGFPVGRNVGGGLEGCRARIGGIGGVGNNLEDRRRAGRTSSSKTVSCVITLARLARLDVPSERRRLFGRCCRSSALRGS